MIVTSEPRIYSVFGFGNHVVMWHCTVVCCSVLASELYCACELFVYFGAT